VLTPQHRQEALCRAYIQAVAAAAGVSCEWRLTDYGIDLSLYDIKRRGQRRIESGRSIDVQAKSTTLANVDGPTIKYDMEVKTYEDLRDPEVRRARLLVLLVLPEDESQWLHQTPEELVLRRCAYWFSLRGCGPVPNQRSIRIAISRSNIFSVEALREILARTNETGEP
jgi:hypothetical protein